MKTQCGGKAGKIMSKTSCGGSKRKESVPRSEGASEKKTRGERKCRACESWLGPLKKWVGT